MIKHAKKYYLVIIIIGILFILLESVMRSAVFSPLFIFDAKSKKNDTVQILIGYSTIHGNYLLTTHDYSNNHNYSTEQQSTAQLKLGNTIYKFFKVNIPDIDLNGKISTTEQHFEVITRNGIVASFSENTKLVLVKGNAFFNIYKLEIEKENPRVRIELRPEHALTKVIGVFLFSIIFPALLLFLFSTVAIKYRRKQNCQDNDNNKVPVMELIVLFIMFSPYFLAILLPLFLNYNYSMSYMLIFTGSYLISILTTILLPVFISLFLTVQVHNLSLKGVFQDTEDKHPDFKSEEDESLNRKEIPQRVKWAILIIFTFTFAYFYITNYLLPIDVLATITYDLFWFFVWTLSYSIIAFIGYYHLHYYTGNYTMVSDNLLLNSIKNLENTLGVKICLFVMQDSENEYNAWVYALKSLCTGRINIYLTEGVMKHFDAKEITAIVAHEIGHFKLHHLRYSLLLAFAVTVSIGFVTFFGRKLMLAFGWRQFTFIVLLGLFIGNMITKWIPNTIAKILEHKADEYAVKLTGEKELYIQTLVKLIELNESKGHSCTRGDWRDTHPSLQKRVEYINKIITQVKNV